MATAPREPERPLQLWLDVERPILSRPRRSRAPTPEVITHPAPDRQMELRMVPAPVPGRAEPRVEPRQPFEVDAVPAMPARQPFGAWLLDQGKRSGLIGELAKAVKLDRAFPKNGTANEVRARFGHLGADGDAFEALDDAEMEYDRLFPA